VSNVRLTLGYISKAQIQQIVSYVKRCGSKSSPVIVAGDLNVIDTRWQYPEIVNPFGDVGLVRLELDEGTTTVVGESLLVVDHVFARGFDGYTVATGEFSRPTETSGRDKWFTDHNGVLVVAVGTGGR
jgi:endonuclease/exonuclease/phosphatase (EEP) superfamily protein YafD